LKIPNGQWESANQRKTDNTLAKFLVGSVLSIFNVLCVVLLYVFTFWFLCCDVRYDFRIKRWSVRTYFKLFVGRFMSYLRYLCLLAHSGVQNILCCACVLFVFILYTLCCWFLWMVHFWLPFRYSLLVIFYVCKTNLLQLTCLE
jgi:hypothetical protein